jgi:hypothetical protein
MPLTAFGIRPGVYPRIVEEAGYYPGLQDPGSILRRRQ